MMSGFRLKLGVKNTIEIAPYSTPDTSDQFDTIALNCSRNKTYIVVKHCDTVQHLAILGCLYSSFEFAFYTTTHIIVRPDFLFNFCSPCSFVCSPMYSSSLRSQFLLCSYFSVQCAFPAGISCILFDASHVGIVLQKALSFQSFLVLLHLVVLTPSLLSSKGYFVGVPCSRVGNIVSSKCLLKMFVSELIHT